MSAAHSYGGDQRGNVVFMIAVRNHCQLYRWIFNGYLALTLWPWNSLVIGASVFTNKDWTTSRNHIFIYILSNMYRTEISTHKYVLNCYVTCIISALLFRNTLCWSIKKSLKKYGLTLCWMVACLCSISLFSMAESITSWSSWQSNQTKEN